jgi:hypothetical protein
MQNHPSKPRPPELSPQEVASNWLIGSVTCAGIGGTALGNTLSLIEAGYEAQSQIPPLTLEGFLIISSVVCFDRFLQKRQQIRRNL